MMDDSNPLHGVDLDAWDVPCTSPSTADRVIERMRAAGGVPVLAPPPSHDRSRGRWILFGGFVAAAVAAAIAIAAMPAEHAAKPAPIAAQPRIEQPAPVQQPPVVEQPTPVPLPAGSGSAPAPDTCADLEQRGVDAMSLGEHAKALSYFDRAYDCGGSARRANLAFASACNARSAAKAKQYFPLTTVRGIEQRCVANRVEYKSAVAATPPPKCDLQAILARGRDHMAMAAYGIAAVAFERAYGCAPSGEVANMTFLAACRARNEPLAQRFQGLITNRGLEKYCIDNGVALANASPPVTPPPTTPPIATKAKPVPCDATALIDKGREHMSKAEYNAGALVYEQAYACMPTGDIANLVFLGACRGGNAALVRRFHNRITKRGLERYCTENGIALDGSADIGTLEIESEPAGAGVFVDGKQVGVAPLTLQVQPGKHRVTYVVGNNDRYTFAVTVEGGKTVRLKKDLSSASP